MKELIKSIINKSPAPLRDKINVLRKRRYRQIVRREWENMGKPVPPPHEVKQITISEYQKRYGYNILIETGTFLGHMVEAQRESFKRIYSIELDQILWENAVTKFKSYSHIEIIQGDSGKVLSDICIKLKSPAIFWLDGHYSEGITAKGDLNCPIFGELDGIFKNPGLSHIILIDDARDFVGRNDYPTVEDVISFVQQKDSRYKAEVMNDIIRFTID